MPSRGRKICDIIKLSHQVKTKRQCMKAANFSRPHQQAVHSKNRRDPQVNEKGKIVDKIEMKPLSHSKVLLLALLFCSLGSLNKRKEKGKNGGRQGN